MPFTQGINHMQTLTTNAVCKTKHSNREFPAPNILPTLVLYYPGRIQNHGDYKLELNKRALYHTDIVRAVHDSTLQGNGKILTDFLVDLFQNGLNANTNYNITINVKGNPLTLNEFKYLVYWIVLQEDINFPRSMGKMGVRMPLIRYIEGAIAALHPQLLSLDEVLTRTDNHGRPPEPAFIHPAVTPYLTKNIKMI